MSGSDAGGRLTWRVATDAVGLVVAVAAAAWGALSAAIEGGDVGGAVGPYAAIVAGFVAARLVSRVDPAIAPAAIVVIGCAVILASGPDEIFSARPLDGPWHYSAATAAFYLQCAYAAALLLADHRSSVRPLGLAIVPFAIVPLATTSWSAVAGIVLVPVALGLRALLGTRRAIAICAVGALLAIGVSTLLAVTYEPGRGGTFGDVIDATLTERRLERQHDAWRMLVDHPLTGVGAGRYDDVSASVARDADAPWAHHDVLQHGGEAGLPGAVALVALVVWAFLRLRRSIWARARSVLVAGALLAVVVHSCTELVVDRPAVVALVAALVGCALHPRHAGGSMVRA